MRRLKVAPFPALSNTTSTHSLFEIWTNIKYPYINQCLGKSKQMFARCQILAGLCTAYSHSLHTIERKEECDGVFVNLINRLGVLSHITVEH